MQNSGTLTVVICAFNEQDWITKALDSLLQQKRLPDEIIVVNNASTDSTAAVVQQFIDTHKNHKIRMVYEAQKGLYHARDAGWRAAASDIIVCTDADITFPPDWLQQIDQLMRDPAIVAVTGTTRYTDANPIANWVTAMGESKLVQGINTHLNGGNSAIRRRVLEEVDGYHGKPFDEFEDQYLTKKINNAGYQVKFVLDLKVWHTFRRFQKEGLWGYIRYIFYYTAENIYPDHLSEESPYTIAVVVPVHNAEPTMSACLNSLITQEPPPHEIILVDNGSTDETLKRIDTFIAQHPDAPIRVLHEPRSGLEHARDTGWRAAASQIIVQVDADEVFPHGWMAKIHAAFICNPTAGAVGGEIRAAQRLAPKGLLQMLHNLHMRWRSRKSVHLPNGMSAYRRDALEKLNRMPQSAEIEQMGYTLRFNPNIYAIRSR